MNLNTLHHYLTTLSPSELRYRAGERYTGWENMPKVFVQDKEYSLLKYYRHRFSCVPTSGSSSESWNPCRASGNLY